MIQKVEMAGLKLPTLYISDRLDEVQMCREKGVPCIKWNGSLTSFLQCLLRPAIEKMFPGICWNKVLGRRRKIDSEIWMVPGRKSDRLYDFESYDKTEQDAFLAKQGLDGVASDLDDGFGRDVEMAEGERDCCGGLGHADTVVYDKISVYDYIGDVKSCINIEVLQRLHLLPKFLGEIGECIRANLSNSMYWTEGYNKKLGYPLGRFNGARQLPNLIILDISYSIPDGIAASMLALIDTLRVECNAELIITSMRSGWYGIGEELPSLQTLRNYYDRSNESRMFAGILAKHIAGKEYGHVISFGDFDNPGRIEDISIDGKPLIEIMRGTKVHEVHHYHTFRNSQTGYARWVGEICPDAVQHIDTSWCEVMDRKRRLW